MRGIERRLRKIEKSIPWKGCPVHGDQLAVYTFMNNEDGRASLALLRQQLEQCDYCRGQNPLVILFHEYTKPPEETKPLTSPQSFSFTFGNDDNPEMPKITFQRWDKNEDLN